jgi:hypothetical protein
MRDWHKSPHISNIKYCAFFIGVRSEASSPSSPKIARAALTTGSWVTTRMIVVRVGQNPILDLVYSVNFEFFLERGAWKGFIPLGKRWHSHKVNLYLEDCSREVLVQPLFLFLKNS